MQSPGQYVVMKKSKMSVYVFFMVAGSCPSFQRTVQHLHQEVLWGVCLPLACRRKRDMTVTQSEDLYRQFWCWKYVLNTFGLCCNSSFRTTCDRC